MSSFVIDPLRPHLGGNLIGGDPSCWCAEVWAALIESYSVRSMLDVGCGTGDALRWFADKGIETIGIEGLPQNAVQCPPPVIVHDLASGPAPAAGDVDLVWCCEVVEHVDETHIENLLDVLCRGRVLAMTHAVPGQGGFHHVNERPAGYWIEKIEARGFRFIESVSRDLRSLVTDRKNYFSVSGLVFER